MFKGVGVIIIVLLTLLHGKMILRTIVVIFAQHLNGTSLGTEAVEQIFCKKRLPTIKLILLVQRYAFRPRESMLYSQVLGFWIGLC